jgi:hypothetical protein
LLAFLLSFCSLCLFSSFFSSFFAFLFGGFVGFLYLCCVAGWGGVALVFPRRAVSRVSFSFFRFRPRAAGPRRCCAGGQPPWSGVGVRFFLFSLRFPALCGRCPCISQGSRGRRPGGLLVGCRAVWRVPCAGVRAGFPGFAVFRWRVVRVAPRFFPRFSPFLFFFPFFFAVSPSPSSVFAPVAALVSGFGVVGVSGPRSCPVSCPGGAACSCGRVAAAAAAAGFCAGLAGLSPRPAVSVGCVSGVSAVCRAAFGCPGAFARPASGGVVSPAPGLSVWAVSASGGFGGVSGAPAFARRSLAFVASVAAARGLFVSFFAGASCPSGVLPSRPFSGSGSGSWGSAAAAVAAGCASLCFLPGPAPVRFPAPWGARFSLVAAAPGGSWWFAPAVAPVSAASSPSLF